jgi:hypothetical protein
MTAKKHDEPELAPGAPMSFRDYVGDLKVDEVVPVEIAYPQEQEPVSEPAKPATKKEN